MNTTINTINYCLDLIDSGRILVDAKNGKIYRKKVGTVVHDNWKEIKGHKDERGYLRVCFNFRNKKKSIRIHQVIFISVHRKKYKNMEIDHDNNIKDDNRIDNLKPVSHSKNLFNAYRKHNVNRPFGETQGNSKLKEEDILLIRELRKTHKLKELAKKFNVRMSTIHGIAEMKSWKHVK